jgi:hypothetical protein
MLALGLIPLGFLLIMPPQPLTLKITAVGLSISFEMFSLCFARSLKQTRRWLDDYYDRLQRDKRIVQAWQLVDTIEDVKLRDKMKANLAQCLFRDEPQIGDLEKVLRGVFQRPVLRRDRKTKS